MEVARAVAKAVVGWGAARAVAGWEAARAVVGWGVAPIATRAAACC